MRAGATQPRKALWVHGNTVLLESNPRVWRVVRQGGRGRVQPTAPKRGGKGHEILWMHFSFPTPVPSRLKGAVLKFDSGNGMGVAHVHVWDGDRRIFVQDRSWEQRLVGRRTATFELPKPVAVQNALCLSVGVILERGGLTQARYLWIDFISAGALLE